MRNLFRLILKNYFVLLFLLLETLALIFLFQFNPYQKSLFVHLSRQVNGNLYESIGRVRKYFYLKEDNEKLILENTRLRNEISQNREIVTIVKRASDSLVCDSLSDYQRWEYFYAAAEVINNSVNKQYNYITIDKGTKQGIHADMAVISNDAVVGIVAGVSDNYSTVMPILNKNFRAGAMIRRNQYFGILEWNGESEQEADLKEIPLHVDVAIGDTIVTSGFSSIFPQNYIIGVVESFSPGDGNFYNIQVRLAVNFRNLTQVNVVAHLYQEEIEALEKEVGYD